MVLRVYAPVVVHGFNIVDDEVWPLRIVTLKEQYDNLCENGVTKWKPWKSAKCVNPPFYIIAPKNIARECDEYITRNGRCYLHCDMRNGNVYVARVAPEELRVMLLPPREVKEPVATLVLLRLGTRRFLVPRGNVRVLPFGFVLHASVVAARFYVLVFRDEVLSEEEAVQRIKEMLVNV